MGAVPYGQFCPDLCLHLADRDARQTLAAQDDREGRAFEGRRDDLFQNSLFVLHWLASMLIL